MRWFEYLIFAVIVLVTSGCQEEKRPRHCSDRTYYYWKTAFQLDEKTTAALQKPKTLYVRFFDIDRSDNIQAPIPIAPIRWISDLPKHLDIVPVIFLTQRSLEPLRGETIDSLAANIILFTTQIAQEQNRKITSIQLDCDWTLPTQQPYFELLKAIKAQSNWNVQSTVRLHQLKDKHRAGIPPVDTAVIMCYNTLPISDRSSHNSILDSLTAATYLHYVHNYPLEVHLALPIFHWGVIFRDGAFFKIVNELDASSLDTMTWQPIALNQYRYQPSEGIWQGLYLYEGDELRVEQPREVDVKVMERIFRKELEQKNQENYQLLYYHLDSSLISHYDTSELY